MQHLGLDDWPTVAAKDSTELGRLVNALERWEADEDAHGLALPRAKCHDDKSIAVVQR